MNFNLPNDRSGFLVLVFIGLGILTVIVHIGFAIGVHADACFGNQRSSYPKENSFRWNSHLDDRNAAGRSLRRGNLLGDASLHIESRSSEQNRLRSWKTRIGRSYVDKNQHSSLLPFL
jgi:hypothetical protein